MKFLFKRRVLFILFGLFILGTLIYMTIMLNSLSNDETSLFVYKSDVESLRRKIESLEGKAAENEKNLKVLENFYKNLAELKPNVTGHVKTRSSSSSSSSPSTSSTSTTTESSTQPEPHVEEPKPIDEKPPLPVDRFRHIDRFRDREKSPLDMMYPPNLGPFGNHLGPFDQHLGPIPNFAEFERLQNFNYLDRMKQFERLNNPIYNLDLRTLKNYPKQCDWLNEIRPIGSDVEVQDLYEKLPFDDIDGGVWKQGFDIKYDPNQWNSNKKLNVIIIPHSHNDPGWIMTFEQYFQQKTRGILDTIVNVLSEKQTRKFVWAETSYLSLWWEQASNDMRAKMKRLIVETKQLEIVTGGWVMTDEANSYYYATIEQMIQGHEWLKANIDPSLRPKHGWSIDPFGYTATMPYLLRQMGFDAMLIQRVHYHLKKYMAQNLKLEFKWRQSWSTLTSKDTSILTHVMPFYSYDIPHTCGPDPKICCQFDFKRMGGSVTCPWGIPPQTITSNNVKERANMLLDQYRKKSQLYGDRFNHDVLLVSLGDDFRYTDMGEAHAQFKNYERLMEYINNEPSLNANIQWGTLEDYFKLLNKNIMDTNRKVDTFSGDFFTYADRNDHYWSGYFTSRIFYKRLDRVVEHYLRSAEIIYSLTNLMQPIVKNKFTSTNPLFKLLQEARHNLGLFQHHDGVAGTSKTFVMQDYGNKLYKSLSNCKEIIEKSVSYLITRDNRNEDLYSIDDFRVMENQASNYKPLIQFSSAQQEDKRIVLYNPNLNRRIELVSFRVNSPHIDVVDSEGVYLKNVQISLLWPNSDGGPLVQENNQKIENPETLSFAADFDETYYELLFEVNVAPMSLSTYTIRKKPDTEKFVDRSSRITFYVNNLNQANVPSINDKIRSKLTNKKLASEKLINFKKASDVETEDNMISLKIDSEFEALFSSKTGLLQKLVSTSHKIKSKIKIIKYGTTKAHEKSGAYLFLPDGPSTNIDHSLLQWIRVEHDAPLRTRVCISMVLLLHCVEFYPTLNKVKSFKFPYMSVWNVVDLRQSHNFELALHIETDVQNAGTLFTDLNGFQYTKRKTQSKLPIQGNVFPMPSGAFIQDKQMRVNLLAAQPGGVASLEPSSIQVFLDRRLDQDDNRGMEQAMNDNLVTPSRFLIFFEPINSITASADKTESIASEYPSLLSSWLSFDLLNPIVKLVLNKPDAGNLHKVLKFGNSKKNYPCDLRLINFRSMQKSLEEPIPNEVGLIFHRVPFEDCPAAPFVQLPGFIHGQCDNEDYSHFSFEDFFEFLKDKNPSYSNSNLNRFNISNTYLTLVHKEDAFLEQNQEKLIKKTDFILNYIQPMQIEAFRINLS